VAIQWQSIAVSLQPVSAEWPIAAPQGWYPGCLLRRQPLPVCPRRGPPLPRRACGWNTCWGVL